jgi:hypothetical protein
MEKFNLNEGNDALKRVLLMMKYDNTKTLKENTEIILEQVNPSDAADITHSIYQQFMGDVQSSDLQDVQDILNNQVFGKVYEDGSCLLSKINLYMKATKSGNLLDYFTTLASISGSDMKNKDLMGLIQSSTEEGEPQFNDIKSKLIKSIQNELKGFCLTKKRTSPVGEKPAVGGKPKSSYKFCKGTYTKGCKSNAIIQIQGCLGLKPDGFFGPKTQAALQAKGYNNGFTDADITKICNMSTTPPASAPNPDETIDTSQDLVTNQGGV